MARIRSIKPEFPQSESMGNVSREARLLFILLWPICDDHGRTRAASRMLASTLFPYDDDAKDLIEGWLDELERENCIHRYQANGSTYLEVRNWLMHQKIDKPSKPQFPEPSESPREDSRILPLGREGKGKEGKGEEARAIETANAVSHPPAGADGDGGAADTQKTKRSDPIPYQAIVDVFNRTLTRLPKARTLTPKRRTLIRSAWQAAPERRSVDFWEALAAEYEADDFTNGTGPYLNGHEGWRPSIDYLLRADVVTRTFERAMDRMERAP